MTTSPHGSEPEKLVKMANQIGDFFKSYPEATAVEGVREHIAKFWNRKMRDEFFAHLDELHYPWVDETSNPAYRLFLGT